MEKKYGLKYFKPGWQGGGLFMQFICGIFLDETATKLGYSEANFAFAQMLHARKIGYRYGVGRLHKIQMAGVWAWARSGMVW